VPLWCACIDTIHAADNQACIGTDKSDARFVRIDNAGHFVHYEKPDETNRAIGQWLLE
jgi:pimeloyl-ACP methyl ester carboxylesterase